MRIAKNHKQMSTHMPMLIKAVQSTTGDVCELGSGFNSTPLLHWLTQGRKLVTYENDPDYLHFSMKFKTHNHKVRHLNEVDYNKHWSVVFIDHNNRPNKRGDDVKRFQNADLIVIHDSEKPEEYGYADLNFKYRYDWKDCEPWTTVLSNTIDVTQWTSQS
jgi:hypothetical protein